MKNRRIGYVGMALGVALVALLFLFGAVERTGNVQADAVTNYYTRTVLSGSTAYTTTGGQATGFDISGYGSAVVHVIADSSNTTSTLTVYPQYSNELVVCSSASNWFTGTDYIPYSNGAGTQAVLDPAQISLTTQNTTTAPITVSYSYGSSSVTTYTISAAGAGYNSVAQSLATTGDTVAGREFTVYGRCMRLNMTVSAGTVTPTIYVMQVDRYD